jgi:hypothetical protein
MEITVTPLSPHPNDPEYRSHQDTDRSTGSST